MSGHTYYIQVSFASNTTHHVRLNIAGTFYGLTIPATSTIVATTVAQKPNLLIVEGDSYTQGYHQDTGWPYWFDGWVWRLSGQFNNCVVVPSAWGGTGFIHTNGGAGPKFVDRIYSDVCQVYTNALNSGQYNNIFITASGSVNDHSEDTNALYLQVTNYYTILKANCPAAKIFFVGNWRQGLGFSAPTDNELGEDSKFQQAAAALGIPYYSPIQANLLNSATYNIFFQGDTDSIHPGRAGYAIMANFVSTNLVATYGNDWTGTNSTAGVPSLNVTNYGALGDAIQFYVGTTSNLTLITSSVSLPVSYIGKTIEVFHVGPWHYGYNEWGTLVNDDEDLVTTITNIVGGTNVYLATPCLRSWTNTFATAGTDNTPAFGSAIAAASGHTNFIVNIPSGTFLLLPEFRILSSGAHDSTYSSIYLNGGGIHFQGAGMTNTVLLGKGAWTYTNDLDGNQSVFRGTLVEVASMYQTPFTNNFPLMFSDLTLDGGLELGTGNSLAHGYPANNVTGNGWGGRHDAYILTGADNASGRAGSQTLSNLLFKGWRAEMLISIDAYKNGSMTITNCVFTDGNATALNIYPTLDVGGCTFSNMFQVAELYQFWCNTGTNRFHDNLITNLTGNGFAWNGATGTNAPYVFERNTVYFNNNSGDCLMTTPGCNISVISNTVVMRSSWSTFMVIGSAGYQGYCNNSNIVVAGNNVTSLAWGNTFMALGAGSPNDAANVSIYNNSISGFQYALNTGDTCTNVQFYSNTLNSAGFSADNTTTPYVLVQTNNVWSAYGYNDESSGTNNFSYGGGKSGYWGPKMQFLRQHSTYYLRPAVTNLNPTGAFIEFDNTKNALGENVPVLIGSPEYVQYVSYGNKLKIYWHGTAWTTNSFSPSAPPSPPTQLRIHN